MITKLLALGALILAAVAVAVAGKTKHPWRLRLLAAICVAVGLWLMGPRIALKLQQVYVDWNAPTFTGIDPVLREYEAHEVLAGLEAPVHVTHAGDGTGRLFVVEQWGRVRVVKDSALLDEPFLDLSAEVWAGGECGLLSIAFHPDYAANGRAFVNFTRKQGTLETVIAEVTRSAAPNRAEPGYRELLVFTQPYTNHNGGQVAFGPDGYLYVGTGDGGAANDPLEAGQDTRTLLGKLLRLDVNAEGKPYAIPQDNPFADGKAGLPEIYAWGLRNPWRFSWDPANPERLFVADVGQNAWEEVHLVRLGDNCGWNVMEGTHRFREGSTEGLTLPIHEYDHSVGYSITGGYVYRGDELPKLQGSYVFADYAPGAIWALSEKDGEWTSRVIGEHLFRLSSFGVDEAGELYALDRENGRLMRLERAAPQED